MAEIAGHMEKPRWLEELQVVYRDYIQISLPVARREVDKRISQMTDEELEEVCLFFLGGSRIRVLSRDYREKYLTGKVCSTAVKL